VNIAFVRRKFFAATNGLSATEIIRSVLERADASIALLQIGKHLS